MTPRDTAYRLASNPADYRRCRAFLAERMDVAWSLSFPTVYAERQGQVVGVLATQGRKDAIVAGPLAVMGRSPFMAMRLIDAYDRIMRMAGVRFYDFHVFKANDVWRRTLEGLGMQPWHEDEHGAWFRRSLNVAA